MSILNHDILWGNEEGWKLRGIPINNELDYRTMAKIWKEKYDAILHRNKMWGVPANTSPDLKLVPRWVFFVRVCSFTFEFHSLNQIEACLRYYSEKIHPSTRLPVYTENLGGDHWEMQRWFEQLPMYLREEPKRQRIVKALTSALAQFEAEGFQRVSEIQPTDST